MRSVLVGLYARISLDRHDEAGVERQLADCRVLAERRGWETVEYVDNDISAFQRRKRPEYERMLADLDAGVIQAIVAYHPDRLYRRVTELERLVSLVDARRAQILTVMAGDIDLSTASGRMQARIGGVFAQHESERQGERIARMKKDKASRGEHGGGGRRAFGLTADRTKIVAPEAKQLRKTITNLINGATLSGEARRLNAGGMTTTLGHQFSPDSVARIIRAPYIAGLRTYHGEIVGDAGWPAIVDRATFDKVNSIKALRQRGARASGKYLLTGLLACGKCGFKMYARPAGYEREVSYACGTGPTTRGEGCRGVSIRQATVESFVSEQVEGWLKDREFADQLAAFRRGTRLNAKQIRVELAEVDRLAVVLAERWMSGELSDREHEAARRKLEERREATNLAVGASVSRGGASPAQLLQLWKRASAARRNDLLRELAKVPIVVLPFRDEHGNRRSVEERVVLNRAWG